MSLTKHILFMGILSKMLLTKQSVVLSRATSGRVTICLISAVKCFHVPINVTAIGVPVIASLDFALESRFTLAVKPVFMF